MSNSVAYGDSPSTHEVVFGRYLSDLAGVRGSMQRFMAEDMPPFARIRFEQAYLKLCEAYELLMLGAVNR